MRNPQLTELLPGLIRAGTRTENAEFHNSSRGWMDFERFEVYIRVGEVVINRATFESKICVQISNIGTLEANSEHTGIFSRMLKTIESLTDLPLYLENTRPDFAEALVERHGWKVTKVDIVGRYTLWRENNVNVG
jgi:hypothetical protein